MRKKIGFLFLVFIFPVFALAAGSSDLDLEDLPALPQKTPPPPRSSNPLLSGNFPSGSLDDLALQGIAVGESERAALINGQKVTPGDRVLGFTVVSIDRDRVILQEGDDEVVLTLKPF